MKRGFLLKPCTTKATAIPPATTAKSTETAATITAPSKLERDLRNGHLHPGSGGRGAKGTPLDTKRAAKQEHSGLPSPGSSGTPSVEDMPTLLRLPKPPLKCTICRYDIQSYEELFWMAKCYNSTCSAKFMSLCMCSIDYDGVPNIKYYAKLDIKGRIVSENYNVTPEQARKTTEEPHVDAKLPHCTPPSSVETENVEPADGKKEKKSKKKRKSSKSQTNKRSESQSTSERPNIQKHDDSMVPESTKDKMQDTISSKAHELEPVKEDVEVVHSPEYQESVVEDHEIPPLLSAVRVQPASELDAVPLLHSGDDDVEKNAVVEKPPLSSSKHAVERNRVRISFTFEDKMEDTISSNAHELEPVEKGVEVVGSPEYQESVVEDREILPLLSAVRVQPASELDAVPLLHREDDVVEKNTIVEKPPISSSKHAVEGNRAASIDHLVTDMKDVTPEEAHEHGQVCYIFSGTWLAFSCVLCGLQQEMTLSDGPGVMELRKTHRGDLFWLELIDSVERPVHKGVTLDPRRSSERQAAARSTMKTTADS
ncbi:unnamed protein product [Heligmosomoides polygyrus]|uniref:JmjC domain-containing protein n=1 Tax=Heligmosomoides polygyrus TaxID=6339 RepID=A0A183FGC5_HELPZ|nr:unnamed protein product [Heligmosomoides polygyrus]